MNTQSQKETQDNRQEHLQRAGIIKKQIAITTYMACGARDFIADSDDNGNTALQFRVTINRARKNIIRVTLLPTDVYKVQLIEIKRKTFQHVTVKEESEVYCDMLSEVIYDMVNK